MRAGSLVGACYLCLKIALAVNGLPTTRTHRLPDPAHGPDAHLTNRWLGFGLATSVTELQGRYESLQSEPHVIIGAGSVLFTFPLPFFVTETRWDGTVAGALTVVIAAAWSFAGSASLGVLAFAVLESELGAVSGTPAWTVTSAKPATPSAGPVQRTSYARLAS